MTRFRNLKIATKVGGGFVFMLVLVSICGGAGLIGVNRLAGALAYTTGPAWDAADGAMEASIGTEAEMLAVAKILDVVEPHSPVVDEAKALLVSGGAMASEALGRMRASGLMTSDEVSALDELLEGYQTERRRVLDAHREWADLHLRQQRNFARFQDFMTELEEVGDGAFERLEATPELSFSWAGGLVDRWEAADGGMETQIALLRRNYYYQRLIAGEESDAVVDGLSEAQADLESGRARIRASTYFQNPVQGGDFGGSSWADTFDRQLAMHRDDFDASIASHARLVEAEADYARLASSLLASLERIEQVGDSKVEGEVENMAATSMLARTAILVCTIASIFAAALFGFVIVSSIRRPLAEAVMAAERLADGDLAFDLHASGSDEPGQVLAAMSRMLTQMRRIVTDVKLGADGLRRASTQVAASARDLSTGTSEQATAAEETNASLEEMNASIGQNAENCMQLESMAMKGSQDAENSGKAVEEAVKAMRTIADRISIVEEIAYQTNLLALNAAIEAARAGEHGKGFAVVAAEVRKLAERSQEAAREIGEVAAASVDVASRSGDLLAELVPAIQGTSELVREVAAASREQFSGVVQISDAMNQVDQVTQSNASSAEELSGTAEQLAQQAGSLNDLMAFFRVDGMDRHVARMERGPDFDRSEPEEPPPTRRISDHDDHFTSF